MWKKIYNKTKTRQKESKTWLKKFTEHLVCELLNPKPQQKPEPQMNKIQNWSVETETYRTTPLVQSFTWLILCYASVPA